MELLVFFGEWGFVIWAGLIALDQILSFFARWEE